MNRGDDRSLRRLGGDNVPTDVNCKLAFIANTSEGDAVIDMEAIKLCCLVENGKSLAQYHDHLTFFCISLFQLFTI